MKPGRALPDKKAFDSLTRHGGPTGVFGVDRDDRQGRWILHVTLPEQPLSLEVASAPANDPQHIVVGFVANGASDIEGCQIKILVGDQVTDFKANETRSYKGHAFRTVVDEAFFKRMLAAKELAARVCGYEWRPSEDDKKTLGEYEQRFAEEAKWARGQQGPREAAAPPEQPAGASETPSEAAPSSATAAAPSSP